MKTKSRALCLGIMFLAGSDSMAGMKISFLIAAAWWCFLALPLFRNVRERRSGETISPLDGFRRLAATAREIGRYRNAVLFLIAYFLYIDGVGTIFMMATPLSVDIGISSTWLLCTILALQFLAFPFTILYGRLSRMIPARTLVYWAIGVYVLVSLLCGVIPSLSSATHKLRVFLAVAFLIGTSQGGIQSLSRSFFTRLIPNGQSAEFFGFYNIFGKFTTILGPLLVGFAGWLFASSEIGIALLAIPFLLGACLLAKVRLPSERRRGVWHG